MNFLLDFRISKEKCIYSFSGPNMLPYEWPIGLIKNK